MIYKTKHTEVDFWFKDKHSIIQRRTMILEGRFTETDRRFGRFTLLRRGKKNYAIDRDRKSVV